MRALGEHGVNPGFFNSIRITSAGVLPVFKTECVQAVPTVALPRFSGVSVTVSAKLGRRFEHRCRESLPAVLQDFNARSRQLQLKQVAELVLTDGFKNEIRNQSVVEI